MITAKIILDSVNPAGIRLTTFEVTYNRFLHPEIMTHRALSRNSASSRAIPVAKMIERVRNNPALPAFWAKNQSGMQATEELTGDDLSISRYHWIHASEAAADYAQCLTDRGCHKAIANRVLEPFSHITVIITATYFDNFFALRAHPKAQQEFQVLAYKMLDLYLKHEPALLFWNEWHWPYMVPEDFVGIDIQDPSIIDLFTKVSAARCARVSYLNQSGVRDMSEDLRLHNDLVAGLPRHASALEHPAMALENRDTVDDGSAFVGQWEFETPSNFHPSWRQYRKLIPQENMTKVNLNAIMATKPDWIIL